MKPFSQEQTTHRAHLHSWPRALALILVLCCFPGAVAFGTEEPEAEQEWPTASPQEAGLDSKATARLVQRLRDGESGAVDGLLVVRHGKLAVEEYFNGFGPDDLHELRSVTKSVVGLLVGVALERGILESIDAPLLPFFPEYESVLYPDPSKAEITLQHLLTMSPGLDCNDFEQFSAGNEGRMYPRGDWVKFFLDLPISQSRPGEGWGYCTAGVMTLGAVLENVTGKRVEELSGPLLFEPMGIETYDWGRPNRRGRTNVCGDLKLRPRDMAKLGQMMLDGGRWKEKQVVSREWVEASTRRHRVRGNNFFLESVVEPEDTFYGYLWWVEPWKVGERTVETFYATGFAGQKIFVFPSLDMVVVMTGSNFQSGDLAHRKPVQLLAEELLPGVE